jgi:hypothetical protein
MSNAVFEPQKPRAPLDCPVVVFVFNRPELTKDLIEQIGQVKPTKLYVISDGPRAGVQEDGRLVSETRNLFSTLDWHCELRTLFREQNFGCRRSISEGLDWVFSFEERAIILEDDCFPDLSFFEFADLMLSEHSTNREIGCICGSNLDGNLGFSSGNELRLSKFPAVWGWATWSRAWNQVETDLSKYSYRKICSLIAQNVQTTQARLYFFSKFVLIKRNALDTWDYQMTLKFWERQMKAIIPRPNMISNRGFGNSATNTIWSNVKYFNVSTSDAAGYLGENLSTLPPFEPRVDRETERQRLSISIFRFCVEVAFAFSPAWIRQAAVQLLRKVRKTPKSAPHKKGHE